MASSPNDPEGVVIPISPDVGVLFTRNAEEASQFEIEEDGQLGEVNWGNLTATFTSGMNIVAQVWNGLSHAAGIVRLTDSTLEAMSAGAQAMKVNGAFGGVLLKNGKIAQHVGWLPATGAQAATVLSALGPAASLFALTLQMTALSQRIGSVEQKLDRILDILEQEHRSSLKFAAGKILEALKHVNGNGQIPEHLQAQLRDAESSISKAFDFFTNTLKDHQAAKRNATNHEKQQVLDHMQAAQLATDVRFRINWILAQQEPAESRRVSLEITFDQHFKDSTVIEECGTRIHRTALRQELLEPSLRHKAEKKAGEVKEMALSLLPNKKAKEEPFSLLEGLEQLLPQLAIQVPEDAVLVGAQPDSPEAKLAALGLAELAPKDTLVAMAVADKHLLVLSKEMFHAPRLKDLEKNGVLGETNDLSELRYLRISDPKEKDGRLSLELCWKNRSDSFVIKPDDDVAEWQTALATFFDRLAAHVRHPCDDELTAPLWLTGSAPCGVKQLTAGDPDQDDTA